MKKTIVASIAAMAKNRVIGVKNGLPWHIPEDLKFFRQKTLNKIIIMGRKTFESVGSKPMPKRLNVVVTRQKDFKAEGVHVFNSCEEALNFARLEIEKSGQSPSPWGNEIMVCGGEEIYRQMMPYTDRIYLTVIEKDFDGDAKFPEFSDTQCKLTEKLDRTDPIPFSFRIYER